jgi:hypothetical protein
MSNTWEERAQAVLFAVEHSRVKMVSIIAVQEMYLQSVTEGTSLHQVKAAEVSAKLDALFSTEVLAVTQPPAAFPVPAERPPPQDLAVGINEIADLRRRLHDAQTQRDAALRERDELSTKLEASEVRATQTKIIVAEPWLHGKKAHDSCDMSIQDFKSPTPLASARLDMLEQLWSAGHMCRRSAKRTRRACSTRHARCRRVCSARRAASCTPRTG